MKFRPSHFTVLLAAAAGDGFQLLESPAFLSRIPATLRATVGALFEQLRVSFSYQRSIDEWGKLPPREREPLCTRSWPKV